MAGRKLPKTVVRRNRGAQRKRKRTISGMNPNDRWITRHFEELVETYGGKHIAVAHEQVAAVGEDSLQVLKKARAKYPDENPTLMHVPRPEALECLL